MWYSKSKNILFKICLPIIIILMILNAFIPDRDTIRLMFISSYVTTDNVDMVKENTKEAIDYIFDKLEEYENSKIE